MSVVNLTEKKNDIMRTITQHVKLIVALLFESETFVTHVGDGRTIHEPRALPPSVYTPCRDRSGHIFLTTQEKNGLSFSTGTNEIVIHIECSAINAEAVT
jgi:hypothetical protein